MKLSYKILWVDDQIEDYIDMGIKAEFETYLDSLGFISIIETFENGSKAEDSLKLVKYDLILSDYNIEGGNEQGDTLIQKIRDGGIFTEVLFYSAQDNFEEIAKNLYRDRVSFFSLIGDEGMKEFRSRTLRLIDLTISKLQELNNIRGLVMSETSELDNKIVDILTSYFSNESENTEPLREYIIKAIQKSAKGNYNKSISLYELDFKQVLKHRIFDADKKAMTIAKLLELKGLNQGNLNYENFYTNYKAEVIDKRNDLAHAKSDVIDGVEYLILSRKDGEHPEKFNQEMCIEIRRNLRKHSEILRSIFEQIIA